MSGLEQMQAAVAAAWDASLTPPELRDACIAFSTGEATKDRTSELLAYVMVLVGEWVESGANEGHDRRVLEQVAWQTLHKALSMHCRMVKERDGLPFQPARIAIVAFHIADVIAKAEPFKCDIDGALAAIRDVREETP